jgi:transposase
LIAAGYQVFAINPMSVARYRERHSTSGAKSDAGDAHVLAEIVRLDRDHHRPVAGDSTQAEAVKLVARTHQSLIWDRSRQLLRLRSTLRGVLPHRPAGLRRPHRPRRVGTAVPGTGPGPGRAAIPRPDRRRITPGSAP